GAPRNGCATDGARGLAAACAHLAEDDLTRPTGWHRHADAANRALQPKVGRVQLALAGQQQAQEARYQVPASGPGQERAEQRRPQDPLGVADEQEPGSAEPG